MSLDSSTNDYDQQLPEAGEQQKASSPPRCSLSPHLGFATFENTKYIVHNRMQLIQSLPCLLVDLIDPVGVVLRVDVVEAVVLEPQAQGVKLTHTLNKCQ